MYLYFLFRPCLFLLFSLYLSYIKCIFFYFSLSFIFPLFVLSFMFPLKSNFTLFTVFSCTYFKSPLQYFLISSTSLLTYVYLLCIPCFLFVCFFSFISFCTLFIFWMIYFGTAVCSANTVNSNNYANKALLTLYTVEVKSLHAPCRICKMLIIYQVIFFI